jgi:Transglycosylase-like domain
MPSIATWRAARAPRDGHTRRLRGSMALLALVAIGALPALGAADASPNLGDDVVDHVETVAVAESLRHGARAAEVVTAAPNSVTVPNPADQVQAFLAAIPKPKPKPAPAPAPAPAPDRAAAPAPSGGIWYSLAQCESGGNWSIASGNGFYGGLQFTVSSWRAVGGSGYPHQASPATQIAMGQRLQAAQGWGAWPACASKLGLR